MKINRWDFITKKYEPSTIPDSWVSKPFSKDMNEMIHCVACGKTIERGESLSSLELHSDMGIGYPVCADCYRQEMLRRLQAMKRDTEKGIRRKEDL